MLLGTTVLMGPRDPYCADAMTPTAVMRLLAATGPAKLPRGGRAVRVQEEPPDSDRTVCVTVLTVEVLDGAVMLRAPVLCPR